MKKKVWQIILLLSSLIALLIQFKVMLDVSNQNTLETIIQFFSYFTILSNLSILLFASTQLFNARNTSNIFNFTTATSAVTVYIFIVGLVYQIVLRQLWHPTGWAKICDELLHTVNPIFMIFYWWHFEAHHLVNWDKIKYWLIYPVFYLVYILIRGKYSGFYPYPFINANQLSQKVLITNILALIVVFVLTSVVVVFIAKKKSKSV